MDQFHWQKSHQINQKQSKPNEQAKGSPSNASNIKLNNQQTYPAKIFINNQQEQGKRPQPHIQLSIPQSNGQVVQMNQALTQVPTGITTNQPLKATLNVNAGGGLTINMTPDNQQLSTTSSLHPIKLDLSNQQVTNLLSLNKAYHQSQPQHMATTHNSSAVNTVGQVIQSADLLLQLKLPGLNQPIQLPEAIASLLTGKSSVNVQLIAQEKSIQLQLMLSTISKGALPQNSHNQSLPIVFNITAEQLTPIIKQALQQANRQTLHINQQSLATKITFDNQLTINLGKKLPTLHSTGQVNIKLAQFIGTQLCLQLSDAKRQAPISIDIPSQQLNLTLRQALQLHLQAPMQTQQKAPSQLSGGAEETKLDLDTTSTLNPTLSSTNKTSDNLRDSLNPSTISPLLNTLLRLLLPKKTDWTQGFNILTSLQKLPSNHEKTTQTAADIGNNSAVDTQKNISNQGSDRSASPPLELKSLLSQLNQAVPDHDTPLDDQFIATIMKQLLNYQPTKLATPTQQPTPAHAVAHIIQVLLGAKTIKNASHNTSTQLLQQIQQLTQSSTAEVKDLRQSLQGLANHEQTTNTLKALTGIQANIRHQQIENLEKRVEGQLQLELNLPLKVDNQIKELHIAINEEKQNNENSSKHSSIWNLHLTFDLDLLGKMLVNAKLKDGEVNLHLYAEQPKTLRLINKFTAHLTENLLSHGLKIKNIHITLGKINTNQHRKTNSLLQIKV